MMQPDVDVLEDIAVGAAVLGTGGGGDPTLGKLMAQQAVTQHGPLSLISVDEIADDAWIIPTAMMGAPTVLVEKIPSGTEVLDAFRMVERRVECQAVATFSIEAGGINSMIPMVVAATFGLPIVDADDMGRAFTEIQIVIPTLHGVTATQFAILLQKTRPGRPAYSVFSRENGLLCNTSVEKYCNRSESVRLTLFDH